MNPNMLNTPMPFTPPLDGIPTPIRGVLKLTDIPYSVTKAEIVKYLGKDVTEDFISSEGWGPAIHIIMERTTGKTMDCYVELEDKEAADYHIDCNFAACRDAGGDPKIGNRRVRMEVSTQAELLEKMFPRAKCVDWTNVKPVIVENTDVYSTGFDGFLTSEEFFCLYQQAIHPGKYPYSTTCPQRLYESIIDLLWKFPWTSDDTYTLEARNDIVSMYLRTMVVLVRKVEKKKIMGLNMQLLCDYIHAGLNCRAFSERQRSLVKAYAGTAGSYFQIKPAHSYWPFDVVGFHYGHQDEESCKFWLNIVEKGVQALPLTELMPEYFFQFAGRLPSGLPAPIAITFFEYRDDMKTLTFALATKLEISLSQRILRAGLAKYEEEQKEQNVFAQLCAETKEMEDINEAIGADGYRATAWREALERRQAGSPSKFIQGRNRRASDPVDSPVGNARIAVDFGNSPLQPFMDPPCGASGSIYGQGQNANASAPNLNVTVFNIRRPEPRVSRAIPIVDPNTATRVPAALSSNDRAIMDIEEATEDEDDLDTDVTPPTEDSDAKSESDVGPATPPA